MTIEYTVYGRDIKHHAHQGDLDSTVRFLKTCDPQSRWTIIKTITYRPVTLTAADHLETFETP